MSKKFFVLLSIAAFAAILLMGCNTKAEEAKPAWVVPGYATTYSLAERWSCYEYHMLQEEDFPVNAGEVALCYSKTDQNGFTPYSDLPKIVSLYGQFCDFKLVSINRNKIVVSLETSIDNERLVNDCREAFYIPAKYYAEILVAYPQNEDFRLETEILPIPVYIQIITP